MTNAGPLRVLLVGESAADARLILAELERGGYAVSAEPVQTAEGIQDALGRNRWDVVISNFETSRCGSLETLAILGRMGQDLPFIVVSGSVGEEAAVAALKAGAHDFVSRSHLARLVPAVERELRDVRARRERAAAHDALLQSEAQHRSLVERAAFGIFRADRDGTFLTVNPALVTMLRYASAGDLLAVSLNDVFVDAAARDGLLRRVPDRGRIAGEEVLWQPRSGDPIRVRLSGATVEGSTPGAAVIEVIVEDVTERHRLREQVRQAQKMQSIGHLAGGIAHDFNNLLTAILGYSELLTEQIGPDVQTGRDLREIRTAAERAAALTRQLLAFSRRQVLTLAPVDVNAIVVGLGAMLRRLAGARVTVRTQLAERVRAVMADTTQLEQVLVNLAVNARDAMPDGGMLTIETGSADLDAVSAAAYPGATPGPCALITVRDTGVGMSRDIRERIFEPFFTTKDRGRGTGLGLAAVHGIVSQLGGCIRVESEPGRGTAFHVYLPETRQAVKAESAPGAVMSAAGSETILLVEDEDAVRAFVRTVLERFGYHVLDAPDAESAIALLGASNAPIDLLLTDVILPKMDGPELARRVVRDRPATRVLFMSGYPERMATADGVLEPGLELLEKPFTAQAILARVRELLGRGAAAPAA